ncbi:hypothetical protein FDE76_17350 [Clostridium botulinum]|uniref:Uncharacterized protein n=1 Tax=Clostridium botulinum (strain Eklund 17B / Type B) TaxID=935198 RepID=B2TNT4_CLOBB|nr:conserved hypothetical protein [Clostridium botulinum B str. Eklund 17B (NRP)]MBY6976206.1 hypothetical protein [Clostridium botulinum]MBY7000631.1 hypothetical protein [Clostridium botulinum]MCR1273393.1 hypothetical protein [Clostridium botulinum]NFD70487.1 hypothetical protein [Clostridium botulinum]
MFTIEEYISKRKHEDNLNEFDKKKRIENIKSCIDYIFEYYNNYIEINNIDDGTVLNNEKIEKYRKYVSNYNEEVQEWLISIFNKHENNMNIIIRHVLEKNELFLLYNTDAEFRNESYECYSKLVKKYPYLKSDTEKLFQFIKDYHRLESNEEIEIPYFSDKITKWIRDTKETYGVNVIVFVYGYMNKFLNEEDKWPRTYKKKIKNNSYSDEWHYEYDYKKKRNLFNIDLLYPKISNKPFIKGKKQYLEILMMHYWIGDEDKEYFEEYLNKVLGDNQ